VSDPRDDVDAWLHEEVEPLGPPPGTFERIRKQARRRRARRVLASAASAGVAAAVIALAFVALPRVVPTVLHLKSNAASDTSAARPVRSSPTPTASHAATSLAPTPDATASHLVPAGPPPVPVNFAATSVTFIGLHTGWVIGQAGIPGQCATRYCTSVARTDDAGKTWFGAPAPHAGPPAAGTGVSQIRFLDDRDGWAFGPALWATHDGGRHWSQVRLPGLRVLSLETTGSQAFAVLARCTGTGAGFAAGCTKFWLYSSAAGSDHWGRVPGTASASVQAGSAGSATVVLTGTQGYWYTPDGLLSGPVTPGAPWAAAGGSAPPCLPGAAGQGGGLLAASGPGHLALACPGTSQSGTGQSGQSGQSGTGQSMTIYVSPDGGQNWHQQGSLTVDGTATSLAASTGGVMALATSHRIEASSDGGATWRPVQHGPAGGFSYVGLTSPTQGVAVPADASHQAVWFTFNGGQAWTRSPIKGG
jgi:hypothetical protein